MARLDVGDHPGKADAGIALQYFLDGDVNAAFGEAFLVGADRQQLAIDQHAIAIEDDTFPAHADHPAE